MFLATKKSQITCVLMHDDPSVIGVKDPVCGIQKGLFEEFYHNIGRTQILYR